MSPEASEPRRRKADQSILINGLSGAWAQLAQLSAVGAIIVLLFMMERNRGQEQVERHEDRTTLLAEVRENRTQTKEAIVLFQTTLSQQRQHDTDQRALTRQQIEMLTKTLEADRAACAETMKAVQALLKTLQKQLGEPNP